MKLRFLFLLAWGLVATDVFAAERIPAAPTRYFNDYAGVVSRATADRLNGQLEQFEKSTSNQLLVVLYPKMESDSSVQDYTVRVAQAWGVGQKGRNNGAVLFAFMQSQDLYLQVGYGLEGAIPDAIAKRIIQNEIVPRFRKGDMDGGMTAAVTAMMAAAKGEYRGTGRTVAENANRSQARGGLIFFVIIAIIILVVVANAASGNNGRSIIINGRRSRPFGRRSIWWGGGGGGSSWGGGGGGGGFSGGGGSFGGGGAGGKW